MLFGYTRAEILTQSVLVLSPANREEETSAILDAVKNGESVDRVETERIAKDGTVLKLLLSIAPIRAVDGAFAGALGIYRDLSEQRRAEEALGASERRYHSVVEALNEGVLLQDADGRVVAFNKSAERIFGLSADELIKSSSDRPQVSLIHEDGSPFLGHEHPTIVSMRSGEPQQDIIMGVESEVGPTRWISINSSALRRPGEDEPYASVASCADITQYRDTLAELHQARLDDLKRLALVGEYRDDDTYCHTERVAHTAELLAGKLGLSGQDRSTILSAAPLHDVGKIGIPDSILLKPGKLTAEEFEVIKTHTVIGGRILGDSHFRILQVATEIALTHHERWDGAGYPSQLRGEDIPIAGRIVAVADAFDAMTHSRVYKDAFTVNHAVAEIIRCSGTQFDPRIVDAFIALDHRRLVA
jgi:putative two-component system response regulator